MPWRSMNSIPRVLALTIGCQHSTGRLTGRGTRVSSLSEEHVKMFGPLGFVPGITPAQVEAAARRGGWDAAGVPTLDHYLKLGSWFAGTPDDLVAHLKSFEERYPGMQHINLSPPLTTPKDKMVEQYRMVGELVMPHFRSRPAVQAAAK